MVSLLKNIFGKRELTDAELYASYNKSPKTVKDFDIYIMSIKEGKESIALKEICGINLTNINEIEQLTGNKIIHTIQDAEPIGPKKMTDIMIIAPCSRKYIRKT